MYVQLNLSSGVSLRRAYFDQRNVCEHTLIQDHMQTPLTQEEYRERVAFLNLNIGEFCLYQDKLLQFKRNLAEVFENLSGSVSFKD